MDAIVRIQSFGFSTAKAAEAFMMCDKNEELALNFLFEEEAQEQYKIAVEASMTEPVEEKKPAENIERTEKEEEDDYDELYG